jgi:hypothetical protein
MQINVGQNIKIFSYKKKQWRPPSKKKKRGKNLQQKIFFVNTSRKSASRRRTQKNSFSTAVSRAYMITSKKKLRVKGMSARLGKAEWLQGNKNRHNKLKRYKWHVLGTRHINATET